MTIANVQAAINARRAMGQKVYGCKVNGADLQDLVRELPTATYAGAYAVLATTNGVRTFSVDGVRCVPRAAVPVGTIVVVSVMADVDV